MTYEEFDAMVTKMCCEYFFKVCQECKHTPDNHAPLGFHSECACKCRATSEA